MKSSIMAIAAVVIVIAAGGAAAYTLLKDDSDTYSVNLPTADYTLLDSTSNIVPGMTIMSALAGEDQEGHTKKVVETVAGGMVTYTIDEYSKYDFYSSGYWTIDEFEPNSYMVPFDYTSSTHPGVTVTVIGDTYTLNGTFSKTVSGDTTTCVYDSLNITYDSSDVSAVSGKMKITESETGYTETTECSFRMQAGVLQSKQTFRNIGTQECDVADFYDEALVLPYPDYDGATVVQSQEVLGNVTADVSLVNGISYGTHFENYKCYSYNGYSLKETGKVFDRDGIYLMSIFIE